MIGQVIVMEPTAYQAWLASGGGTGSMAATDSSCSASWVAGPATVSILKAAAPILRAYINKKVMLDDGRTVVADENYLRESILNPGAKVVSGFKPIMPSYQGQFRRKV